MTSNVNENVPFSNLRAVVIPIVVALHPALPGTGQGRAKGAAAGGNSARGRRR